jgi:hypothetical protein
MSPRCWTQWLDIDPIYCTTGTGEGDSLPIDKRREDTCEAESWS